ncbi:hypothetical protein DYQ86_03000 [Acidobacteria bacterium AB60]|nr:hypothetical protein DYQ86_03000 [Acidobacteria bacterium AB60]
MHVDGYTKGVLTLIALLLAVIAIRPLGTPQSVNAQAAGLVHGYLIPQAGEATPEGGKEFIDIRSGQDWYCDFKVCKLHGTFPLNQISDK